MQPQPQGDPRSDAQLISGVRSNDPTALGELFARHVAAATRVARFHARDDFSADDLVSEAFERTFATIRAGGGPELSFRAYLYTAVRRLGIEHAERGKRMIASDDLSEFESFVEPVDPSSSSLENGFVTAAFQSLPERWQAVLWYLEVEGMRPPEIAPLLGLTPNGVSALAYRAREGLREAYLQAHIASPGASTQCDFARGRLGAWVNGSLSRRDDRKVAEHVAGCAECTAVVAELRDVGHGLRAVVAPLLVGSAAAAALVGAGHPSSATAASLGAVGLAREGVGAGTLSLISSGAAAIVGVVAVATLAVLPPSDHSREDLLPTSGAASDPAPTPTAPTLPDVVIAPPVTTPRAQPPTTPPVAPVPPANPPVDPVDPAPTSLALTVDDLGDLVVGRDGMVGATATNTGAAPAEGVVVSFSLPSGVALDPARSISGAGAAWSCAPNGAGVDCSAVGIPAGSTASVAIPVTVAPDAAVGGVAGATVRAASVAPVAVESAHTVVARGFGLRYLASGAVDSVVAGGSFLDCDPSSIECLQARDFVGSPDYWDNQSLTLFAQDRAGVGAVSSTAIVEVPSGSSVQFAGLYWSGVVPAGAADDALGGITLRSPAGTEVAVTASRVDRAVIDVAERYQSFADVTAVVAVGGAGTWAAIDPALAGVSSPGNAAPPGSHGGWSLVVVYADAAAPVSRVAVFDGLETVIDEPVSFEVASGVGTSTRVGVVAWEGDAGLDGDSVLVDGTTLQRDAAGVGADNALASRASGSASTNTFGVDVGWFEPVATSGTRVSVSATTNGDQYGLGALVTIVR